MPSAAGLYYFSHGEENSTRPPLILIHGAGGTNLHWPPDIRRLTGERVYALDLPGHGKSAGIGRQFINDYVQALIDFMDALKMGRAIFAGHSMGSAISINLALDHPRRSLGLVLAGAGARLRVAPQILDNAANPATFPLAVQTINEWAFGSGTPARMKELAAQRMAETRPSVLHGDFLACDRFDALERVAGIDIPTLIICGAEDKLTPLKYSEYLHAQIKNSTLQTVEGAGHMVMLEKPSAVAQAISSFVDSVEYRPGEAA
jgi:pimeloyl-ACP methyl ester carboxylesterase